MIIDESYRNKLYIYLTSFDENIERDLLEVDVYDKEYQKECYKKFYELKNNFYEECKKSNRPDVCFRYPYDWNDLVSKVYINEMINLYGSLEYIPEHIQHPIKAYLMFEKNSKEEFGKVIGRSNDRYDYFMYLKYGLTYRPKYISKEELVKILKANKYGYSAHCIF